MIHVTFAKPSTWGSSIKDKIGKFFGETVETTKWSGGNSDAARKKAAENIEKDIVAFHKKNPKKNIRLVGHSHGGNVAIMVVNRLAKKKIKVRTLIAIATPVREYQLKTKVGQFLNVYNELDKVQSEYAQYDLDVVKNNVIGDGVKATKHPIITRKFANAENIKVTLPLVKKTIYVKGEKITKMVPYGPMEAHSAMHNNVNIWNKYIFPKLKK